jgi:CNT family concentrative nucleoside transporter
MSLWINIAGMLLLLIIAVLFSNNKKAISLKTTLSAFCLQLLIGAAVLYFPEGYKVLYSISQSVSKVIACANDGIDFLFGPLSSVKMFDVFGNLGFVFAFKVLPVIIFLSSLISVLYHLGIMQWVIKSLGAVLSLVLGTSKPESISAAANIFVGHTEAPLLVRPFLSRMTESELFAVMCGGLASVAGAAIAGYYAMGIKLEYLIAASFMSAPGGLLFAKIIIPETQKPIENLANLEDVDNEKAVNLIDAAAAGAASGLKVAVTIGAMLLAFIGLIALVNTSIEAIGSIFGVQGLTIESILGWVFSPLTYLLGMSWSEAHIAGSLIGQKLVLNEFVAYSKFAQHLYDGSIVLSAKSQIIISFALCGFANLSSVAVLLGGLGSLAPKRKHDIARLGMRAVLAGTLSNLMSATIAGLFFSLGGF